MKLRLLTPNPSSSRTRAMCTEENGGALELELEAMRKEDFSWHPCQVSLSPDGLGLLIDFGSEESEDMISNKEEVLKRIRIRSLPLQGDDCLQINEGDHVLANYKSQYKGLFFDAKVEKVLRVKHSKRVFCRCSFEIKWLHQGVEGESLIVPSSSIQKWATKSIRNHPTIAAFFSKVQTIDFSSESPNLNSSLDMDLDMELNIMLEKQIKQISCLGSTKVIAEDVEMEVNKVHPSGQMLCKQIVASEISFPDAQITYDQNKVQKKMEARGPPHPAPSILERSSENRSPLNPLAARATLACLVSTPQNLAFTMDQGEKGLENALFSSSCEFAGASSNGILCEPSKVKASMVKLFEQKECVDKKNANHNSFITRSVTESKAEQPAKVTRTTRSTGKEGTTSAIKNQNVKASAEGPKSTTVDNIGKTPESSVVKSGRKLNQPVKVGRLTRSAIKKQIRCQPGELEQVLEECKSEFVVSDETEGADDFVDKSAEVCKSSRHSTKERKLSQPAKISRLTRSAIQKGICNGDDGVEPMANSEDSNSGIPASFEQLLCPAVKNEKGLQTSDFERMPEEDKSEFVVSDKEKGNMTLHDSNSGRKKNLRSSVHDPLIDSPCPKKSSKKQKMSNTADTDQSAEGKSSGNKAGKEEKKKMPTSKNQELQSSPRLKHLPRTRSQTKT
ncbi:SAWADEE domain [Dillenia turbinata]|uniref:SAWADEE domain n=1 Tax=Dillenia turbinata TaxID=194707 RepID=A0AAN8WAG5_9MAGN